MPLDNPQGYCAAPGLFWPCAGRAGAFEMPPQMPEIGLADRLRVPAGFGQGRQHGIPPPNSMTPVDQRHQVSDQILSGSAERHDAGRGARLLFVVPVVQQSIYPELGSKAPVRPASDFHSNMPERQVPCRAAVAGPNQSRPQQLRQQSGQHRQMAQDEVSRRTATG